MNTEEFVKEVEQNVEWFCERITEPVPLHPKDKERILQRMMTLGWIRQSEIDTYNEITKED